MSRASQQNRYQQPGRGTSLPSRPPMKLTGTQHQSSFIGRGSNNTKGNNYPASRGNVDQVRGNSRVSTFHRPPSSTNTRQQNGYARSQVDYSRKPSTLVQVPSPEHDHLLSKLKSETEKLRGENTQLKAEIDHLTSRLSSFASKQLSAGNPNITDLSDLNRPSKIGENFTQVYDDEWTDAFEALRTITKNEEEIVKTLSFLAQKCFEFSKSESKKQQGHMVTMMRTCMLMQDHQLGNAFAPDERLHSICQRYAKDFRKDAAKTSIPGLRKLFKDTELKHQEIYKRLASTTSGKTHVKELEKYCDVLVELAWLMNVQDPPMVMCFAKEGEPFNKDEFKEYNKKGKITKICVWPSVRLHSDGPLVSKGHVLPV